ncbi:MAG: DUF6754 domain-containing protein [Candidatus Cloacimonadota bacterium]|nr:DUF6754 domain-containing protein [Candidatus Cloacimonadota bacterium]
MRKILFSLFLFSSILWAQELVFSAEDNPNDDGTAILLKWNADALQPTTLRIIKYEENGDSTLVHLSTDTNGQYILGDGIVPQEPANFRLQLLDIDGNIIAQKEVQAVSKAQWFNTNKISLLIMAIILSAAIIYYIFSARSGKKLYIRKIAGLESIDESVGRATEMGRAILFIPGTLDLDNMQTISGLSILGKLAQKVAENDAKIMVPVCRSMVLSTAKEVVKEAYLKAGKPDAYDSDSVFYLTDDQFGFVAGVDGIIVREKPAANFFLGAFYAESLILAETGFASGAVQTAGTAMPSQLPFFVVACDYTLIGEELFAASAYLSKEPQQLGSLKGQDFGKAIFLIVLSVGVFLEIIGVHFLKNFLTIN